MKGGPAEVALSTMYGYNDNAYKFVFGDRDGMRFSIRDQGEYLWMKGGPAKVTHSSVYGYNDNAYKFVFGDGDGTRFSIRDQGKGFLFVYFLIFGGHESFLWSH